MRILRISGNQPSRKTITGHFSRQINQGSRIVVAALVPAKWDENAALIAEVIDRIQACGGIVAGTLIQRRGVSRSRKPGGIRAYRSAINAATFIGTGKVQELAALVAQSQADAVVFCNPLSMTQIRNVEKIVGAPVVRIVF